MLLPTPFVLLAGITSFASAVTSCVNYDSPNPIASQYPDFVTGTLNGTIMIVPIPLEEARALIPDKWPILETAYRLLLPHFPEGMYPMMAVGVHDHDIHPPEVLKFTFPDFSRAAFEFPFVDILNDGYTSFRLAATMMITKDSPAIAGTALYGIKTYPAEFEPSCNAFDVNKKGEVVFKAKSVSLLSKPKYFSLEARDCTSDAHPYSLDFLKNITNQPTSANGLLCDDYQRSFDTPLSTPPNEPTIIKGTVKGFIEPFSSQQKWEGVYGWKVSTAFREAPLPKTCKELQGSTGANQSP